MICDLCDYHVAHTYCCGFGREFPPEDEDWICEYCNGLLTDNSDSYDSSSDSDIIPSHMLRAPFSNPFRGPTFFERMISDVVGILERSSNHARRPNVQGRGRG
jgi:hypothetical protein